VEEPNNQNWTRNRKLFLYFYVFLIRYKIKDLQNLEGITPLASLLKKLEETLLKDAVMV
jgi:hypothetical protein